MSQRPPAPRPARSPGRPVRDSADQRARLLDAAIECFVRQGIAGATLRAIAHQAHVTPALLHYYFGDKAQLLDAVVEERLMPALGPVREGLLAAGDDAASLVAAFVRAMGDTVDRHPWLPALWVREVLCEGGALREVLFTRLGPQVPAVLARGLAAAQARGELNPALDPRLVVISLIGLTLFPAAGAPIWRRLFDAGDIDGAALRDHALALLDGGLGLPSRALEPGRSERGQPG